MANVYERHLYRHERMGLQGMGGRFLSRPETPRAFWSLRDTVSHGGNQRHILPDARFIHGAWLARKSSAGVYFCRQGEPVYHPHQAIEQPGALGREFHPARPAPRQKAWAA